MPQGKTGQNDPKALFDGPYVDIPGIEVLKPGVWNGVPISARDVQDIADAFNATRDALPPTARLGHDARQAFAKAMFGDDVRPAVAGDEQGWPNVGEPSRVSVRADGTLVLDVSGVPSRLASWVKGRRVAQRSVGLVRNKVVGGKVYPWFLDHVAFLGAETPAVDGLAPVKLNADADQAVMIQFSASDADGWLTLESGDAEFAAGDAGDTPAETALEKCLAALGATMDEYTPLIYGRKGGPMARQLFAAFTKALRDSARAELPLASTGDNRMTFTLAAVRGILNLADDAPATDVVAALKAADEATTGKVVELAAGGFESAEQLVGWLAGALALAPGDLDGIAEKVAELNGQGGLPDDPNAEPGEPAAPVGEEMSTKDAPVTVPADDPARVALSSQVVELAARTQKLERELVLRDASAKVMTDLAARKLELPNPVRDHLIELAADGKTAAYDAILASTKGVPADEKGTAGDGLDLSFEPTDADISMAVALGYSRDEARALHVNNRRAEAGLPPVKAEGN